MPYKQLAAALPMLRLSKLPEKSLRRIDGSLFDQWDSVLVNDAFTRDVLSRMRLGFTVDGKSLPVADCGKTTVCNTKEVAWCMAEKGQCMEQLSGSVPYRCRVEGREFCSSGQLLSCLEGRLATPGNNVSFDCASSIRELARSVDAAKTMVNMTIHDSAGERVLMVQNTPQGAREAAFMAASKLRARVADQQSYITLMMVVMFFLCCFSRGGNAMNVFGYMHRRMNMPIPRARKIAGPSTATKHASYGSVDVVVARPNVQPYL